MVFCLSEDGRWLCDSRHETVHLWNLQKHCLEQILLTEFQVHRMALSPDGSVLALSFRGRDYIELWDPIHAERTGVLKGHSIGVGGLAFSPDGKWLASCGGEETIRIWDAKTLTATRILRGHALGAGTVAFSPDSKVLASGGADGDVRLWRVTEVPTPALLSNTMPPLAFSPDGRWLVAGHSESNALTGLVALDLAGHEAAFFSSAPPARLLFLGQGHKFLAAILPAAGAPPEIWEHDPSKSSSYLRCRLDGVASPASTVALRGDGREAVTGHRDGSLGWWDTQTGRLLLQRRPYHDWVETISYTPDDRLLLSSTYSPRQLQVWSALTRESLATNNFPGPTRLACAFSPDGARCVTGGFGTELRLWRTETLDLETALSRQRGTVTLFAWSSDGQTLAAATTDGQLRFWNTLTWRLMFCSAALPAAGRTLMDMCFSPDAQWFAACDDRGALTLWHAPRLSQASLLAGQKVLERRR
jgi:WD40 repeat protein